MRIEIVHDRDVPNFFADYLRAAGVTGEEIDGDIPGGTVFTVKPGQVYEDDGQNWGFLSDKYRDPNEGAGHFEYADTWFVDAFHRWSIFTLQWPAITYAAIVGKE